MKNIGVKINLPTGDDDSSAIGKIKETLSRLGIANTHKKIMYPSCYLFEVEDEHTGKYEFRIAHFKELFPLINDYGENNINEEDIVRRNMIVKLLGNWGLIETVKEVQEADKFIFVLPYKEKSNWKISHKLNFRKLS